MISDCVTSYDLKKMDEMYAYYAKKGCEVKELKDYMEGAGCPGVARDPGDLGSATTEVERRPSA